MNSDLVYFVLVPAALAIGLFVAAKANSARLTVITLAVVAALLVVRVVVSASAFPASHTLAGQAWLALVLSPVGHFVGFVLGMNVWLWLGFPL